ncbi:phage tail protein [Verrucomicrobiales bacterium]|nr:phage tail protein [Verrucomicrobiales bacterium]
MNTISKGRIAVTINPLSESGKLNKAWPTKITGTGMNSVGNADAMPALATVGPSAASSSSASRDRRTIDHQRAAIGGDKGAFLSRVIRAG